MVQRRSTWSGLHLRTLDGHLGPLENLQIAFLRELLALVGDDTDTVRSSLTGMNQIQPSSTETMSWMSRPSGSPMPPAPRK